MTEPMAEFLAERLAELDQDVRALAQQERQASPEINVFTDGHQAYIAAGHGDLTPDARSQAEIRYDRVLHDVRAKQMLLREYEEALVQDPDGERARTLDQVIRYHVSTYQDHPGYQSAWRPR